MLRGGGPYRRRDPKAQLVSPRHQARHRRVPSVVIIAPCHCGPFLLEHLRLCCLLFLLNRWGKSFCPVLHRNGKDLCVSRAPATAHRRGALAADRARSGTGAHSRTGRADCLRSLEVSTPIVLVVWPCTSFLLYLLAVSVRC